MRTECYTNNVHREWSISCCQLLVTSFLSSLPSSFHCHVPLLSIHFTDASCTGKPGSDAPALRQNMPLLVTLRRWHVGFGVDRCAWEDLTFLCLLRVFGSITASVCCVLPLGLTSDWRFWWKWVFHMAIALILAVLKLPWQPRMRLVRMPSVFGQTDTLFLQ